MQRSNKNLFLRQNLVNMAITVKPLERAKPKGKGRKIIWSDQQVLEIRALHKFAAVKPAQLAERYNTTKSAITYLLSYNTRLSLEPELKHLPTVEG